LFEHSFIDFPNLETKVIDGKRHYITPTGAVYPSITTILSATESEGLIQWKKNVGEQEATRISKIMARRGQNLHDICEKYLRNYENPSQGHMPDSVSLFTVIKKSINRIGKIYALEQEMYSDEHGIAGRCDVIADYKNILSIVDFKTSNSDTEYTPEKIQKYFVQCKAYAEMFRERTGMNPLYGVLIVGSLDYGLKTYIDDLSKYSNDLKIAITAYKEKRYA
jgi:hypothetical protein